MSEQLNSVFGDTGLSSFQTFLEVSFVGAIVVVAAVLIQILLSKWLSPRFFYVFWVLVVLRFAMFAAPQSPTSFLNLFSQTKNDVSASKSVVAAETILVAGEVFAKSGSAADSPRPSRVLQQATTANAFDFTSLLAPSIFVWLIGVAWMVVRLGLGYRRVKELIDRSRIASPRLVEMLNEHKATLKIRRSVAIRATSQIDVPAVAGVFRPIILIPSWCESGLSARQLEMVVLHELVHIRRYDGAIQTLTHMIGILHWFNPILRIAATRIEGFRELACDAKVIELMAKTHPSSTKRLYGQTILDITTMSNNGKSNQGNQLTSVFLGGFINDDEKLIKQRIAMLVSTSRSKRFFGTLVGAICISLFLAVGFTTAQTVCVPVCQEVIVCPPVICNSGNLFLPTYHHTPIPTPLSEVQAIAADSEPSETVVYKSTENSTTIAIKVHVFEVSKTKLAKLEMDSPGDANRKVVGVADFFKKAIASNATQALAIDVVDNKQFLAFMMGLEKNAVAKLLDQPVLVAFSGKPAEFLSGGEIPIQITDANGNQKIEFRPFGTMLNTTPILQDDGTLILEVRAEVSEIIEDLSGDTEVPGFRVRRINTGVKMAFGKTLALVGDYRSGEKLGDDKTEIVFLLTPRKLPIVAHGVPIDLNQKLR